MELPFSTEQFLNVFAAYNTGVFPMQVVMNLLALTAIYFMFKNTTLSGQLISWILSFFWLWMGLVYHIIYFTAINTAAYIFGILFVLQGFLFIYAGAIHRKLVFRVTWNWTDIIGALFIIYALILYPLMGYQFGHRYPTAPTFGLPCPTTIFTFGVLLFCVKRIPRYILIIPLIWSVIGFMAAIKLTIMEDTGLLVAGVIGTLILYFRSDKPVPAI